MKDYIRKVLEGQSLTFEEASGAMATIMEGKATDAQIGAFLVAEKMKGEEVEELTAFATVMREKSVKVKAKDPFAVDVCGTGGDGSGTFNISTVAAFVVAGAGVTVAKHGNRSISSRCGSADLLAALGVDIFMPPERVEQCINEIGIGFLFAPTFHPAMRYASKPRSELGIQTFFNMVGPLTNPARVEYQLVGTFSLRCAEKVAQVLSRLGVKRAMVLHSADGLDEVSLAAPTIAFQVEKGEDIQRLEIHPLELGLRPCQSRDLAGGTAEENARICLDVLQGQDGPQRHVVALNAAFALYVTGRARTPAEGLAVATESIDSGMALKKLHRLIEASQS